MIRVLIHKPVSVLMSFLAILLLAVFCIRQIAVTLLPDIDIPAISVVAAYPDHSAAEIETTVMAVLRQYLQQVNGIDELRSEAADEQGRLTVHFPYGKDIDLAFIEVNEKLDLAVNALPDDMPRPIVVKTKASDIPAVYLTVRYRDSLSGGSMTDLSEFVSKTVRRRLEQLPSVSMADMTGALSDHFRILPDARKLQMLGITHQQIRESIDRANLSLGNILVRERQYEYRVRVGRPLRSLDELRNLPLKVDDQVYLIRDLAEVSLQPAEQQGRFLDQGHPAFNLAIFKDFGARMKTFERETEETLADLQENHPDLLFHVNRDQGLLLDLSISGMQSALWLGCLLATLIVFFFYRDRRIPVIVGIITPLSLAISVLFLYLAGLSVNIISLSGIVLGIGMMIDNGIIILDNIVQESLSGRSAEEACIRGTNEMILPLLASMLTTCAVFLPLIFLSDLAGALFYDQAVAVSICLAVSYFVSVIFIPVVYFRFFEKKPIRTTAGRGGGDWIRRAYDQGYHFTFDRGAWILVVALAVLVGGWWSYTHLHKETMPALPRQALVADIRWNEPMTPDEMAENVRQLYRSLDTETEDFQAYLGPQQFVLNDHYHLDGESASLYISFRDPEEQERLQENIDAFFSAYHPQASVTFSPDRDVFEVIFPSGTRADYVAYYHNTLTDEETMTAYRSLKKEWSRDYGLRFRTDPPTSEVVVLKSRDRELLRYDVDKNYALEVIAQHLQEIRLAEIRQLDGNVPVVLAAGYEGLDRLFSGLRVVSRQNQSLPLDHFFYTSTRQRLKYVYADERGPYLPVEVDREDLPVLPAAMTARKQSHPGENFRLVSAQLKSRILMREIGLALLASMALLYLILAAQFESLLTPAIILMELPVSLSGALIGLWLTGNTLNAMALIGMVVTIGIVINDSIIKIDTANRMHKTGMPLKEAIHFAGQKRLYPILMTSLTTMLALVPYLWGSSFGVELQKPLAVSLIASMFTGTLLSLFLVPKIYFWMKK